jgi:hypothetical protein
MLYADWIWYVPRTDINIFGDGASGSDVTMNTNVNGSIWEACYFYSTSADFNRVEFKISDSQNYTTTLNEPPRTPTGQLVIHNRETSVYVSEIRIWKPSSNTSNAADYTFTTSNSIAAGEQVSGWLPVDNGYKVQLKIGSNYYHSTARINIIRGETFDLNASASSPDFVPGAF